MAFKDPSVTDSVKFTLFQRAMKLCAGTTDYPLLQSLPSLNIQEPKEVRYSCLLPAIIAMYMYIYPINEDACVK